MEDYKAHPGDTQQAAIDGATEALVRAHPTNRFFVFPMMDRVEIAFGNARHLISKTGEDAFCLEYHSSVSLDTDTLKELHLALSSMVLMLDESDG